MSLKQRVTKLVRNMAPPGRVITIEAADGQDIGHLLEPLAVTNADQVIICRWFGFPGEEPPPPRLGNIFPMVE